LAREKRESMKPPLLKEKKADGAIALHQPQMDDQTAATLTTTQRDEFTVGAGNLQEKMRAAAKAFAELESSYSRPEYRDEPLVERLLPYIHCTPGGAVLFRLGDEWVKLTEENLTAAFQIVWPAYESCHQTMTTYWLSKLRKTAKKYGKVSWVLPKLQKGGALV
jgi:hypothetical protein